VQVLLRNFANTGFDWADAVLRHLVMDVGLFGAVIAARRGRQISIDILGRLARGTLRRVLEWVTGLFTVAVTLTLTLAGIRFLASEIQFGSELPGGLPAWPFQLPIPLGFALIGLQVLLNLLLARPLTSLGEAAITPSSPGSLEAAAETAGEDEEGGGGGGVEQASGREAER
jgi:TRAP-type C4-dicarboxylate transport system permease small subunit